MEALERGTQIVYVPDHAEGDIGHPDCETGFVTSVRGDVAFCRYWSKLHAGLRTMCNSEATSIDKLVVQDTRPQQEVADMLEAIDTVEESLAEIDGEVLAIYRQTNAAELAPDFEGAEMQSGS